MEKAMLIPARSLTRGWKLHAKHQLWHPHCLTLAVAGATEVKNAAQSQQGESSARAELFPSFLPPKQGSVLLKFFPCRGAGGFSNITCFSQSAVAQDELQDAWRSQQNKEVLAHLVTRAGAVCHLPNSLALLSSVEQMPRAALHPTFQAKPRRCGAWGMV